MHPSFSLLLSIKGTQGSQHLKLLSNKPNPIQEKFKTQLKKHSLCLTDMHSHVQKRVMVCKLPGKSRAFSIRLAFFTTTTRIRPFLPSHTTRSFHVPSLHFHSKKTLPQTSSSTRRSDLELGLSVLEQKLLSSLSELKVNRLMAERFPDG